MNIVRKTPRTKSEQIGRLSDGSDRQTVDVTTWTVEFMHGDGVYSAQFSHDPTEADVLQAYEQGLANEIVSAEALSIQVRRLQEVIDAMLGGAQSGE